MNDIIQIRLGLSSKLLTILLFNRLISSWVASWRRRSGSSVCSFSYFFDFRPRNGARMEKAPGAMLVVFLSNLCRFLNESPSERQHHRVFRGTPEPNVTTFHKISQSITGSSWPDLSVRQILRVKAWLCYQLICPVQLHHRTETYTALFPSSRHNGEHSSEVWGPSTSKTGLGKQATSPR